jgi:DNA-binding beta-propeller fold protein YncE
VQVNVREPRFRILKFVVIEWISSAILPGMRRTILFLLCSISFVIPSQSQTLLVANQGDHTLSIVDAASARQVEVVRENITGQWAHEVATSPDGNTAYLPIYGNSGVGKPGIDGRYLLFVDIPAHQITGRLDLGRGVRPHCILYDRNRDLLYVTTELAQAITIVNPKTQQIVGSIPTGQPESHMLALSHDGKRGYTANVGPGTVSVLDIAARKTLAVISVSPNTQRISISNDDKLVFTADQTQPRLAAIDTATNKIKSWIALPALGYGTAPTRDGRSLLVAMPSANKVGVIDLATLKLSRTIDVCRSPQEILVRPDGIAYVSCMASGQVAAIDVKKGSVQATIDVGQGADGLAWSAARLH